MSVRLDAFISYARQRLYLSERNEAWARNTLCDLLGMRLCAPVKTACIASNAEQACKPLIEYALEKSIIRKGEEQALMCRLMNVVMPSPQECERLFPLGSYERLDNFALLCEGCGYIKSSNIRWKADDTEGKLIITINTAKPEKDNAKIARALSEQSDRYPLCDICFENEGYASDAVAKQSLRTLELTLDGEQWFWQFSPYSYFFRHGVAVNKKHLPMKIDQSVPVKLLDFVSAYPSYFIGCNAALPGIGGSILTHEHFQGGRERLPLFDAPYRVVKSGEVSLSIPKWYNNALRLESTSKIALQKAAAYIIRLFEAYSDPEAELLSHTREQRHNSPCIAALKQGDSFVLYIVLRNNRRSEKYPEGIFHAHPEHHGLKREAIGLIEAMGLFVLPGRLEQELKELVRLAHIDGLEDNMLSPRMAVHTQMLRELRRRRMQGDKPEQAAKEYIERACEDILRNTAIFKNTASGRAAFDRFIAQAARF